MKKINIKQLNFQKMGGIIPAIIQDVKTKDVLMLGFMNDEALKRTIKQKRVTFWSRSKKRLWEKGETSGNKLEVVSIKDDCDKDALLVFVKPQGPVCHTGKYSCFGIKKREQLEFLQGLYDLLIERKKVLPKNSYAAFLFKRGLTKILEKVEEESGEVIQAAKKETRARLIEESADLFYHLLVLLVEK
ncbi:bifunctional phosphoribosyl-AMP cyclohydrolase/phosphoribosyl-ATP diphosphatase HisIE, partial [Patescibacteria group bacterium]|nr:bifunctional phosphoribosyl-AMP cyclohydrolase/phosphoribosyl-ATP diphosphatase HisIE [Patescibacteria group bacterium]